jgi:hypothetical protein
MASVESLVKLLHGDLGEKARGQAIEGLKLLRSKAEGALAAQVDQHLREAIARLEEKHAEISGEYAIRPQGELLDQLAELARPPEKPPVAGPASTPKSTPESNEEGDGAGKDAKEAEARKILARMKAAMSSLEARERGEIEKQIKAGRIVNESQLKTKVQRMRAKRRGK